MIESVDRVMETAISECPALVEAVIYDGNIIQTAWMLIEPLEDEWVRVTDLDHRVSMEIPNTTVVRWLKPEDMNSPAVQAELITALAAIGMEL